MWTDLEAVPLIKPTQAKQPDTITRKLKSFQLEGLDWMTKQEKSQWKGGLLGDEMGMGKTIQAVSLIMSDYPAKDPTLVVVVSFCRFSSFCIAQVFFFDRVFASSWDPIKMLRSSVAVEGSFANISYTLLIFLILVTWDFCYCINRISWD